MAGGEGDLEPREDETVTTVFDLQASPRPLHSSELEPAPAAAPPAGGPGLGLQLSNNEDAALQLQPSRSAWNPGSRPSLEDFMADERLGLQRSLAGVGVAVLLLNAVGDYTDPAGRLRNWMALFHNLTPLGAIVLAVLASRWRRLPVIRHWFLLGVAACHMLYLSVFWPAAPWWDGPGHYTDDISDSIGPPMFIWCIGVAGASHWRTQLVVILAMYFYFLPLKVNATPYPHKMDVAVSNGISLGMSCAIAIATNYLREREVAQRYAVRFGGRMNRRGSLAVDVGLGAPPVGLLALPVAPVAPAKGGGVDGDERLAPRADVGVEPAARPTWGRRLRRWAALEFEDPADEEGFRVVRPAPAARAPHAPPQWSVQYARRRTLLAASTLLTAFTVSAIMIWNRTRRSSNPGQAPTVLGVLLAVGVMPGALVLLSATPQRAWRGFWARGWLHQWGVTAAAVAANVSCMTMLGVLPGGRKVIPSLEDYAIWEALLLLANSVPLCLVTLRVRFSFTLGWLACWVAAFATVSIFVDRSTRLLTTSAVFLGLAVAATRDVERERRALWRESIAALSAERAAASAGPHAHEP